MDLLKNSVIDPDISKFAGLRPADLLKKKLWHRGFPVNLAEVLETPFFIEHLFYRILFQIWE